MSKDILGLKSLVAHGVADSIEHYVSLSANERTKFLEGLFERSESLGLITQDEALGKKNELLLTASAENYSTEGKVVGGVIGGLLGWTLGGPTGAGLGATIGAGIGELIGEGSKKGSPPSE